MTNISASNTSGATLATRVSLATARPGGGFPVYGAAFADTINGIDSSLRPIRC